MPALAWNRGYKVGSDTTLISGANAANFTELAGAGVTKTTDTDVTRGGVATTRIFVPAALATNFEIGVNTASLVCPADWNGGNLTTVCKFSDPGRITGVFHYVGDGTYTNFYVTATPGMMSGTLQDGWRWQRTGERAAGLGWQVGGGSPTFPGTKRMKIRFTCTAGADMYVWIAEHRIEARERAKIVFTLDDGYDDHYNFVYPACVARNIPFSMSIDAQFINTTGFCTSAQLRTMLGSGLVEFTNHQKNNQSYITLGLSAFLANVDECDKFIRDLGNSDLASKLLVYTQGSYDATLIAALRGRGYVAAREVGLAARLARTALIAESDDLMMQLPASCNLEDTQPLATVQGYINTAISSGGTFFVMGHQFHPTTASTITWVEADFTTLLDWVKGKQSQGLIDIISWSNWYRGLTQPAL